MSRHGNRWTVNEILSLQREYELLELSVKEIALRHQRSEDAILMKLEAEGFLQEGQEPFVDVDSVDNESFNICINDDLCEEETQIDRIYKLECAMEEITHVVNELVKRLFSSSPKKTSKMYL
jgi:hypothetical protein